MTLWARIQMYGAMALAGIVLILGAFFTGKSRGSSATAKQAEDQARRVQLERENAGHQAMQQASETRRKVEDKVDREGADHARQDLEDNWTRPGD